MRHSRLKIGAVSTLLFGLLGLGGCALSPQTVDLEPQAKVNAQAQLNRQTIQLQALDARPSTVVGSRGGVYADTSLITTGLELPARLRAASAAALSLKGFDATAERQPQALRIYLDELSYQVPEGEYVTQIDLAATIRVVAEANNKGRFTGRYRATQQEVVAKAPSSAGNQELLNQVVSSALTRAFEDPKLYQFLNQQ